MKSTRSCSSTLLTTLALLVVSAILSAGEPMKGPRGQSRWKIDLKKGQILLLKAKGAI